MECGLGGGRLRVAVKRVFILRGLWGGCVCVEKDKAFFILDLYSEKYIYIYYINDGERLI